ncbi:transmembrane transport protein [Kitasatospora sp. NPDC003701]
MSERTGRDGSLPPALRRVIAAETSVRARLGQLAVGLAGLCGAGLIGVLWATEPGGLPARTGIAFAVLIAIGLSWAAFVGWVLARRRPLFAADRVVGGWIALAACTATTAAGVALAAVRGAAGAALGAGLVGGLLTAAAAALLVRARARRAALLRLREALERDAAR